MPLMNQIAKFVQSRQGRRLTQQAMNYAKSPAGKRRIAAVREQLAQRRGPKSR